MAHVCSVRSWTDEEYAEHVQGVSAKVGKMEPWRSPETGETGWVIDAALLTESGVPLDPNAESRRARPPSHRRQLPVLTRCRPARHSRQRRTLCRWLCGRGCCVFIGVSHLHLSS